MQRLLVFLVLLYAFANAAVQLDKLRLLPGWNVQLVTDQVPKARKLAISKDATFMFVGSSLDKVYAVPLLYNIGKNTVTQSGSVKTIASGQVYPHGVVYDDGSDDLYFSANYSSIYKLSNIVKNVNTPPTPQLITNQFPSSSTNGVKTLRFDANQTRIYLAQGVNCDSCLVNYTITPPSYYGEIMSINKDGSDLRVHATGVRNSVGLGSFNSITY
jgi:glucose/arabinose dehydrogenase